MPDPDKPQQIIDAAVRVFARNGYYHSRVSDIAREAGIASGTIYLYFKTKDEILVTLFRERMAEWVAFVRREIAGVPDPLARIRRLVALHFSVLDYSTGVLFYGRCAEAKSPFTLISNIRAPFDVANFGP